MTKIVDQPPPLATSRRPAWDLVVDYVVDYTRQLEASPLFDRVVEDMRERDAVGRERYGVPLTSANGRDHLVDAYQEALDFAVYLAAELGQLGASIAGPTEVPGPVGGRVRRLQEVLKLHVLTILEVRSLIEEREECSS